MSDVKLPVDDEAKIVALVVPKIWSQPADYTSLDQFSLKQLTGGLTNKVFRLSLDGGDDGIADNDDDEERVRDVTVRVFDAAAPTVLVNRARERLVAAFLFKHRLVPPLLAVFPNAYVYRYVYGRNLTVPEMREPRFGRLVGRELARWHSLSDRLQPGELMATDNHIFDEGQSWIEFVETELPEKLRQDYKFDRLKAKWVELRDWVLSRRADFPVTMNHSDLLAGNVLFNETKNEVRFIDFEYAAVNFRGFDLGNMFNEWTWDGDKFAFEYPSAAEQRQFLRYYIGMQDDNESAEQARQLDQLLLESNVFGIVSDFYWSIWSLMQHFFSAIDFDYFKYGNYRTERGCDRLTALLKELE